MVGECAVEGGEGQLTAKTEVFGRGCSFRDVFEGVTGRWSSLVLVALQGETIRFNGLRRRVDGISEKMLAQTLRNLERDGMVDRDVVTSIPPRVEYRLTPTGAAVAQKLWELAAILEASVQGRLRLDRGDETIRGVLAQ